MSQFLTFEEVEHHLSCLPRDIVEQLTTGPLEPPESESDGDPGCRVCNVLGPLAARDDRAGGHARELTDWHEIGVVDLFAIATTDEAADQLEFVDTDTLRDYAGALSYARCCTIYALARSLSRAYNAATRYAA